MTADQITGMLLTAMGASILTRRRTVIDLAQD
jgi:hypothetical protein